MLPTTEELKKKLLPEKTEVVSYHIHKQGPLSYSVSITSTHTYNTKTLHTFTQKGAEKLVTKMLRRYAKDYSYINKDESPETRIRVGEIETVRLWEDTVPDPHADTLAEYDSEAVSIKSPSGVTNPFIREVMEAPIPELSSEEILHGTLREHP